MHIPRAVQEVEIVTAGACGVDAFAKERARRGFEIENRWHIAGERAIGGDGFAAFRRVFHGADPYQHVLTFPNRQPRERVRRRFRHEYALERYPPGLQAWR